MKVTTAVSMITRHDVHCPGCPDCEAAFAVIEANRQNPLVRTAVQDGFGHPKLRRMVPRTATKPRVAAGPKPVPPVLKTEAQWAAHFSTLLNRTENRVPPPPNFNEAVRRHAASQTTTQTTTTRTTASGTPKPPDQAAAVRARRAQETQR